MKLVLEIILALAVVGVGLGILRIAWLVWMASPAEIARARRELAEIKKRRWIVALFRKRHAALNDRGETNV